MIPIVSKPDSARFSRGRPFYKYILIKFEYFNKGNRRLFLFLLRGPYVVLVLLYSIVSLNLLLVHIVQIEI